MNEFLAAMGIFRCDKPGACISAHKVHQTSNSLVLDVKTAAEFRQTNLFQKTGVCLLAFYLKPVLAQVFLL